MENIKERKLNYYINGGEYVFRYGETVLFKNSEKNPFARVTLEKNGLSKEIPLPLCEIEKNKLKGIRIKFYDRIFKVSCNLKTSCEKVIFSVENNFTRGEKLTLKFHCENIISGLGLNVLKFKNAVEVKRENFKNKFIIDNILNFSILDAYFFKNVNIPYWEIKTDKKYYFLSFYKNDGVFVMDFGKKEYGIKKGEFIVKNYSEAEKVNNEEYYMADSLENIKKIRKSGGKVIYKISPLISYSEMKNYNENGIIKTEEGFFLNMSDSENIRYYSNFLRKIFDANANGVYINEKNTKIPPNMEYDDILIYENYHTNLRKIIGEYPKKIIIYDKLNYAEEKGIYLVDYASVKRRESFYIENLLRSGIREIMYRVKEKDYKNKNGMLSDKIYIDNRKRRKAD